MKTSANRYAFAVLLLFVATAAHAEWRTFAGGFSSRWKTIGPHGHDQPYCAEPRWHYYPNGSIGGEFPNCNPVDFARGNLDNSIGFRAGRERDFLRAGPLRLVGGMEGSASYTEYNLTQVDFALLSGAPTAGADLALGGFRVGGRYGGGPFGTSDGQELGISSFREVTVTLPLRRGAGLRISQRSTKAHAHRTMVTIYGAGPGPEVPSVRYPGSPSAVETSVLFVTSPEVIGSSQWEFTTATGSTKPGRGFGSDRMLRKSMFTRFAALRDLPWHDLQLEVSLTTSAHESVLPTMFRGYNGNFRSKTIDAFGVAAWRSLPVTERLTLRYSGGVEVADWRDEHQLLTRDGRGLVAGIEQAFTTAAGLRFQLTPHVALDSTLQKVYWPRIDLGEARWSAGIVLTR
jgi:hypothetical protein